MNCYKSVLGILGLQYAIVFPVLADVADDFSDSYHIESRPWIRIALSADEVTYAGLSASLDSLSRLGIGGVHLSPSSFTNTDEWFTLADQVMSVCDSLGMRMEASIADGQSLPGGPKFTAEEAMQQVVMTDIDSKEGTTIGYYSIPARYLNGEEFFKTKYSTRPQDHYRLTVQASGDDIRVDTIRGSFSASQACSVIYGFDHPITVNNLEIRSTLVSTAHHGLEVSASNDGVHFKPVRQLIPPIIGTSDNEVPATHNITTTTAPYWKFSWQPSTPADTSRTINTPILRVNEIIFHAAPRIHLWEGKAGIVWRHSASEDDMLEPFDYIPFEDVVEISSRYNINTDDVRNFYFRLAAVSKRHTVDHGGHRYYSCDKFNRDAVRRQVEGCFRSYFNSSVSGRADYEHQALAQRVLKHMSTDVWSCGSQNWSPTFAQEFAQRRGYNLSPYLPLMVGFPIENRALSDSILRDVRLTIDELLQENYFSELRRLSLLYDCQLSLCGTSPSMVADGLTHYAYADVPTASVSLASNTSPDIQGLLDAVSAGHIYGKRIIQADISSVDADSTTFIKPEIDYIFSKGVNRLSFAEGLQLDSALIRYVTRCQYLLQLGRPVVDVAVFTGHEMPRRSLLPTDVATFLPGICSRVEAYSTVNPLVGYHYDSFNEDALRRCKVFAGRISMPSVEEASPAYHLLVVPSATRLDPDHVRLPAAVSQNLAQLSDKGVAVVSPKELPWTNSTFSRYHLQRDVDNLPVGVDFCHRTTDDAEIYFLTNQLDREVVLRPSFRDTFNRQPELWNPQDGSIQPMAHEVVLPAYGAVFVVFPLTPTSTEDPFALLRLKK